MELLKNFYIDNQNSQKVCMPGRPLVLAADDEDICLSITKRMLEQLGFSVIAVKNGKEAVTIYRQRNDKILFILLDIHMPLMDGVQASKQIKNISRNAQLVFVSGETNDDFNNEVEALHPLAILKKPISFNELSLVVIGARKTIQMDREDPGQSPKQAGINLKSFPLK